MSSTKRPRRGKDEGVCSDRNREVLDKASKAPGAVRQTARRLYPYHDGCGGPLIPREHIGETWKRRPLRCGKCKATPAVDPAVVERARAAAAEEGLFRQRSEVAIAISDEAKCSALVAWALVAHRGEVQA